MLAAAAGLIMYPGSAAQLELLRLICLIPARSLKPSVLHSATFAWHWISVSAVDLQVDFLVKTLNPISGSNPKPYFLV